MVGRQLEETKRKKKKENQVLKQCEDEVQVECLTSMGKVPAFAL